MMPLRTANLSLRGVMHRRQNHLELTKKITTLNYVLYRSQEALNLMSPLFLSLSFQSLDAMPLMSRVCSLWRRI